MFEALAPSGVYYAVVGVHGASTLLVEWHRANAQRLDPPRLYDIDEVVASFRGVGFDAAAARLAVGFVPTTGHGLDNGGRLRDWLDYYYDQKLLLRVGRPM